MPAQQRLVTADELPQLPLYTTGHGLGLLANLLDRLELQATRAALIRETSDRGAHIPHQAALLSKVSTLMLSAIWRATKSACPLHSL